MREIIERLLVLQGIDTKIGELERLLSTEGDALRVAKDNYGNFEKSYATLESEIRELQLKLNETQNFYDGKKQLYEKSQKKLSTVKNTKEYEAVLKELDTLKREVDGKENVLLGMKEQLCVKNEGLKALETNRQSLEETYRNNLERKQKDSVKFEDELKNLKIKRQEVSATIKKRILSKYEVLRQARGNLAISAVEDEICTGCYMKIPPQLYVEVKKEKELKQCPNCQRFLYYRK